MGRRGRKGRDKTPRASRGASERAQQAKARVPKLARLGVTRPERPLWRLALVDPDGPWGWTQVGGSDLRAILDFLQQMERLSWEEIRNHMTGGNRRRGLKHKYIPFDSLCPEAQARIVELELDEYTDKWFRFRLGARQRLWGVLDDGVFYPVWWDPRHEVCPSERD